MLIGNGPIYDLEDNTILPYFFPSSPRHRPCEPEANLEGGNKIESVPYKRITINE
jgi:hypothetical protein